MDDVNNDLDNILNDLNDLDAFANEVEQEGNYEDGNYDEDEGDVDCYENEEEESPYQTNYAEENSGEELSDEEEHYEEEQMFVVIKTVTGDVQKTVGGVTSKTTGQDLLLLFAEKMNMTSVPMYFGLSVTQESGFDVWFGLDDTIRTLGINSGDHIIFKVRYFKHPKILPDPVIIEMFFKQVANHVINGTWPVGEATGVELGALWLQAQHFDYDPDKHKEGLYEGAELSIFVPKRLLNTLEDKDSHRSLTERLFERHSRFRGMNQEEARIQYIALARGLPTYGASIYQVQVDSTDYVLGVVEEGVLLSKNALDQKVLMPDYEMYLFSNIVEFAQTSYGLDFRLQHYTSGDPLRKIWCCPEMADSLMEIIQDYYMMYMSQEKQKKFEETLAEDDEESIFVDDEYPNHLPPVVIFEYAEERRLSDPQISQLEYFKRLVLSRGTPAPNVLHLLRQIDYAMDHKEELATLQMQRLNIDVGFMEILLEYLFKVQTYETRKDFVRNMPVTTLDYGNNPQIRGPVVEHLYMGLKTPMTVTRLNLSNCNMLDSYGKVLGEICRGITCCVEELIIDNNKLGTRAIVSILKQIKIGGRMRTLSAKGNGLTGSVMKTLGETVSMSGNPLRLVNFSDNEIGDEGVKGFVNAAINTSEILNVQLNNNSIGERGCRHLCRLLTGSSKLEKLGLGDNKLGRKGAAILAETLTHPNCTLQTLNISNGKFEKKGYLVVFESLKGNTSLTYLNIGGCHFDIDMMNCLRSALESNTTLTTLIMSSCTFAVDAFPIICGYLRTSPLESLDLSGNSLTPTDFKALGECLSVNRGLHSLSMNGSAIFGFESQRYFVAPFSNKSNITLKKLELDDCSLGDDGAEKIAALLRLESRLEILSVKNNGISTHGALSLLLAVEVNRFLNIMKLDNNHIILTPRLRQLMGVTNTDLKIAPNGELARQNLKKKK